MITHSIRLVLLSIALFGLSACSENQSETVDTPKLLSDVAEQTTANVETIEEAIAPLDQIEVGKDYHSLSNP